MGNIPLAFSDVNVFSATKKINKNIYNQMSIVFLKWPFIGQNMFLKADAIAQEKLQCSFRRSTGQKAWALEAGDLAANQVLSLFNCGTLA